MTAIAEAAERIRANPTPVLIVDSCNFLDLFRVALPSKDGGEGRRVDVTELEAAKRLLDLLTGSQSPIQLVVPELIPREFYDNAAKVGPPFDKWLKEYDVYQRWVTDASTAIGVPPPSLTLIAPLNLSVQFRSFAERLLATATVLGRDRECLLRAVERVVAKRRPSHAKELKDSMNLEQTLELCRQLAIDGKFPHPVCFVSSNTKDFAEKDRIHPDLKAEFDEVSLLYFTSLRAARGHLLKLKYPV